MATDKQLLTELEKNANLKKLEALLEDAEGICSCIVEHISDRDLFNWNIGEIPDNYDIDFEITLTPTEG